MTATNTTPARKTISLPAGARKPGGTAPAVKTDKAPRVTNDGVVRPTREQARAMAKSEKVWVSTMLQAAGFHRDALVVELAVGLAVFLNRSDAEKVTLDSKKALMKVYADAGFDTATPAGADYKTVNRRINATADLFLKLGARPELGDLTEGMSPEDTVSKLQELVKSLKLDSINAVLAFVGKAVKVSRPRNGNAAGAGSTGSGEMTEAQRQLSAAADADTAKRIADQAAGNRRSTDRLPPARIIVAEHIRVAIPMEATYEEVMEVAAKLAEFAKANLPAPATA